MTTPADRIGLELSGVVQATPDIRLLELRDPGGSALPVFAPGAHLSLTLPSGLERQYSISSDPADRSRYVVAVKREDAGRGGSREVHGLAVGTRLVSRPPVNLFPLAEAPTLPLLIAGGIGITPIMAMVRALRAEGRAFRLVFLARSRAEAAFVDEIEGFGCDAVLHFDDTAGGYLNLAALLADAPAGAVVHCCGPTPLMDAVRAAGATVGWAPERLRFEAFSNDQPAHEAGDRPFTLELARRKASVPVAADETPLQALLKAGFDVDYSCEEGTCGTCITAVLEGEVDHRDAVLMEHEKSSNIVLCCSRAKGAKLVIDL